MRALLDTHVFLYAAALPERLSSKARKAIEDPANEIFVSAAVAWEIAIKHALGKLTLPALPPQYVPAATAALGFRSLPITQDHAVGVWSLPKHHNDPFDRIMIAQALAEGMTLVTSDASIQRYKLRTLTA